MNKIRSALFLLICSLILTSCQKGFVFRFFNNTGSEIRLWSYDTKMQAKEYLIKNGTAMDVASPAALKIRVISTGREWEYRVIQVGKEYWYSRSSFGKFDIRFQVEGDGSIYVLSPGTAAPVSSFPSQPPGYPVKPK
jgi:hypothetical protein